MAKKAKTSPTKLSKRKRLNPTPHEMERQLFETQRLAHIGSWSWTAKTKKITWSAETYSIHGRDPGLPPPTFEELPSLMTPESMDRLIEAHKKILASGTSIEFDLEILHPDEQLHWVLNHVAAERNKSGNVVRLYGTTQDMTERKRMEEALRKSEYAFRTLFEANPIATGLLLNRKIVKVNPAMCRISGYSAEELEGQSIRIAYRDDEEFARVGKILSEQVAQNGVGIAEAHLKLKNGQDVEGLVCMSPLDPRDPSAGVVASLVDITERKRAEEALEKANDLLNAIIDAAPTAIMALDLDGKVHTVWNKAAEKMLGFSAQESIGHVLPHITEVEEREEAEQVRHQIHQGKTLNGVDVRRKKRDGTPIDLSIYGSPLHDAQGKITGNVAVLVDITERKRAEKEKAKLEDQLRQAQKMEAVGRLAGGVAHDFNNMLAVIIGYTNLIKTQLSADEPMLKDILEIERAATRSRDITSQLLAFSRKQTIKPKVLDLNDIVMRTQRTLARLIGEDIELKFCPGKDVWRVMFDPSQIEQILINLAANARDAMPDGGKLTIDTANYYLDDLFCKQHIGFKPGHYAMLGMSDNGVGMDKETLAHVFEPFFTTKEFGKGTGLGLAMVYGIIKQNNGFINIYSEQTQGTSIKIYIPRSMEEEKPEPIDVTPVNLQSGTVLLVEDDDTVRRMTNKMLKAIGYTVLSTAKPQEALSMCETSEVHVDLVLTDVVMPLMSGKELRNKIEALRPGIKTIFMSGYSANVVAERGILEEGVYILQKPFTINELANKIREVLGKR